VYCNVSGDFILETLEKLLFSFFLQYVADRSSRWFLADRPIPGGSECVRRFCIENPKKVSILFFHLQVGTDRFLADTPIPCPCITTGDKQLYLYHQFQTSMVNNVAYNLFLILRFGVDLILVTSVWSHCTSLWSRPDLIQGDDEDILLSLVWSPQFIVIEQIKEEEANLLIWFEKFCLIELFWFGFVSYWR